MLETCRCGDQRGPRKHERHHHAGLVRARLHAIISQLGQEIACDGTLPL
jgi:hypothetical protein